MRRLEEPGHRTLRPRSRIQFREVSEILPRPECDRLRAIFAAGPFRLRNRCSLCLSTLSESAVGQTLGSAIRPSYSTQMVDRFTMKVISYNDQSNTVNTYSPNGLLTEWLITIDLATRSALRV